MSRLLQGKRWQLELSWRLRLDGTASLLPWRCKKTARREAHFQVQSHTWRTAETAGQQFADTDVDPAPDEDAYFATAETGTWGDVRISSACMLLALTV